jgi:hypothetical protein
MNQDSGVWSMPICHRGRGISLRPRRRAGRAGAPVRQATGVRPEMGSQPRRAPPRVPRPHHVSEAFGGWVLDHHAM